MRRRRRGAALGAPDVAEAEAFRRHLDTCTVVRAEELASFQQVTTELLLTAPLHHQAPRRSGAR